MRHRSTGAPAGFPASQMITARAQIMYVWAACGLPSMVIPVKRIITSMSHVHLCVTFKGVGLPASGPLA